MAQRDISNGQNGKKEANNGRREKWSKDTRTIYHARKELKLAPRGPQGQGATGL